MNDQILNVLKVGPMSSRALAKQIKRRRDDVHAACAGLQARGILRRETNFWILEAPKRCRGVNAEGARCGRESALGSDRCSLHADALGVEPKWRKSWTRDHARAIVTMYGSLAKQEEAKGWGIFDQPEPQMLCEAFGRFWAHEARRWCEFNDREWLKHFDALPENPVWFGLGSEPR